MCTKAPVLLPLCLRFAFTYRFLFHVSLPLEKVTLFYYYCFCITEIDDLDAIVPAVKKLKVLSY